MYKCPFINETNTRYIKDLKKETSDFHSGRKVGTALEKKEVRRFRFEPPDPADHPRKAKTRPFWYQDLGSKIPAPRSWYQKTESLRGGASQKLSEGARAARQGVCGAGSPLGTAGSLGGGPPVKTILETQDK